MPVIVAFDVSEQRRPGFCLWRSSALLYEFNLEGVEEALHRVTTPGAAHRGRRADRSQMVDIGAGRVLRPAIGVTDETVTRPFPLSSHHHGRKPQFGPHMIAHRPADYLAGCQLEYGYQMQPPFFGRDIGDVGEPNRIRRGCHKALRQQVRRSREIARLLVGPGRNRRPPKRGCGVAASSARRGTAALPPSAFRLPPAVHSFFQKHPAQYRFLYWQVFIILFILTFSQLQFCMF